MKKKYFLKMGKEEREEVRKWYKNQKSEKTSQNEFIRIVGEAICNIEYDYKIAIIEPSKSENGGIYYEAGKEVLRNLSCREWEMLARNYAPEHGSRLATLYELFLWYAYRIAKEYFSICDVCDMTYLTVKDFVHIFEPSAEHIIGGFADGIGNTYKIVKDSKGAFALCGGCYARFLPISRIIYDDIPTGERRYGVGWLVLED